MGLGYFCLSKTKFLVKQLKMTAIIFIEIKKIKKILYNPRKINTANHLKSICKILDKINATYGNLILLRHFNVKPEKESIAKFLNLCDLKNPFKQNNCFKNPDKPKYITFILINYPRSFFNIRVPLKRDRHIFTKCNDTSSVTLYLF